MFRMAGRQPSAPISWTQCNECKSEQYVQKKYKRLEGYQLSFKVVVVVGLGA